MLFGIYETMVANALKVGSSVYSSSSSNEDHSCIMSDYWS